MFASNYSLCSFLNFFSLGFLNHGLFFSWCVHLCVCIHQVRAGVDKGSKNTHTLRPGVTWSYCGGCEPHTVNVGTELRSVKTQQLLFRPFFVKLFKTSCRAGQLRLRFTEAEAGLELSLPASTSWLYACAGHHSHLAILNVIKDTIWEQLLSKLFEKCRGLCTASTQSFTAWISWLLLPNITPKLLVIPTCTE